MAFYTAILLICALTLGLTSAKMSTPSDIPGIDERESRKREQQSSETRHQDIAYEEEDYYDMTAGRYLNIIPKNHRKLYIFCYKGESKAVTTIFKTVQFNLDIEGEDYYHYEGPNATVIRKEHREASWFSFYPWRSRSFKLNLYTSSCVGIDTAKSFRVGLHIRSSRYGNASFTSRTYPPAPYAKLE
ncbi:hypothetical protein SK128_014302 [Halocaridina rubra]|uniref:Uncharacterized protein n=1 Tax=Halocaridina rubra TaxID=373956 RepID=A0AAN8X332_HALRR